MDIQTIICKQNIHRQYSKPTVEIFYAFVKVIHFLFYFIGVIIYNPFHLSYVYLQNLSIHICHIFLRAVYTTIGFT